MFFSALILFNVEFFNVRFNGTIFSVLGLGKSVERTEVLFFW